MRPKLLEIEGLQSFTDVQRIDFEALGETGLFGIFGPTGSGKSTILDAITFALYGKVKRADGGTQGIINTNRKTASVSYTFELTRDGKRRTYRVERTYQRKKNSENSCEPKIARLIEIMEDGEVPLCDKATEVSSSIKELLGLNNEDFTRAVVLPQNSFQEFLTLDNKDRRSMLERIFYLEEYGKQLCDKLGRKMSTLKSRLDVLSGEILGYSDATDEALEEAEKVMEAAAAERKRVENELRQMEVKFNETKEVWGLIQELGDMNRKEEQQICAGESIAKKRLQLERALKADGLLEMIRKNRDLGAKLNETESHLEEVMTVLPGVIDGLEKTKRSYEDIKNQVVVEQPKLISQRTRLADALSIKSEITAISQQTARLQAAADQLKAGTMQKSSQINKGMLEFELLEKDLERIKQEIEPLNVEPEYRQHVQEGVTLENEVVVLDRNVKELEARGILLKSSGAGIEQRLNGIKAEIASSIKAQEELETKRQQHEASTPGDKIAAMKSMDRIHLVQGMYDILKLRKNELDKLKAKAEQQNTNLHELKQKADVLEKSKDSAVAEFEQCKLEIEKAVAELDQNAAAILSKNLKAGEPCPVCGSTEHPVPAVHAEGTELSVLESRAEAARKKLDEAEKFLKAAEREALIAGEQVKTAADQAAQTMLEAERKTSDYEEEKQKLPEKLRSLELDQIWQEVAKANAAFEKKLEAIEEWEVKQKEYAESLQKLNDILTGQRIAENGIVSELTVNRESAGQLEKSLAEARKTFDEAQQRCSEFLNKYGMGSAGEESKRLAENDRKLQLLQKEAEQTQENAGRKRLSLDSLKEELRLLNNDHIKLDADLSALQNQLAGKEARLTELAGEADIEEEIKRVDEKLDGFVKLEKERLQQLQLFERRHNDLQTQKSLLENQKNIFSDSLKAEEMHLKSVLSERGFADGMEAENSILQPDIQKVLKAEIDGYDQTLTNIHAQKAMLQRKLKSRDISEEEWNRTNTAYTELTAYREECVTRSEVAKNSVDIMKKKHEKWVGLRDSYNGMGHKQGLYEQIQKILKAEHRKDNSFIDYIAEERLRYVAARASETLGVMTKYRYALELDVEAGFIIRDNANGGVHRMVSSLSGGETFLTSLSLALALSEQIQLKGQSPLEFFFLDEGFGTLDHDLLDTVIDALERLSSRERVIGLISHVPELKSRISRRLVIEPPTMQGEGSKVMIEKA
ncbi:MAG: SbcC/MukB-like Walker B domain-containing protein [Clostridiaceae bacterium]